MEYFLKNIIKRRTNRIRDRNVHENMNIRAVTVKISTVLVLNCSSRWLQNLRSQLPYTELYVLYEFSGVDNFRIQNLSGCAHFSRVEKKMIPRALISIQLNRIYALSVPHFFNYRSLNIWRSQSLAYIFINFMSCITFVLHLWSTLNWLLALRLQWKKIISRLVLYQETQNAPKCHGLETTYVRTNIQK